VAEVALLPEAEAEYERALAWYFERSPKAAERSEAAFDEAVAAIRSRPTLYPMADDRHRFVLLRRYPFSLVYRLDVDTVTVIAVAHTSRRPGYWSDRA
jgi:plasmid stabilization system protein ParE